MIIYQISLLVTALTAGSLGIFVLVKNKDSPVNRSWFFLSAAVTIYTVFFQMHITADSPDMALFWGRMCQVGSILASPSFLLFAAHLTGRYESQRKIIWCSLALSVFFYGILWTKLFFSGVEDVPIFNYYASPGPFYPVYLCYFAANAILGHVYLIKALKTRNMAQAMKIRYMLMATCIAFFAGASTFFPLYGITQMGIFSLLLPLYPLIVSFAIVKYQLMDIEVFIRRATVFAGLFIFVYGIITLFTTLWQSYFETSLGWPQWSAMIPSVLFITICIRPVEKSLERATERFLFQKEYDYKELLGLFTTEVLSMLDLKQVTQNMVLALNNIIRLEDCGVYLLEDDGGAFKLDSRHNMVGAPESVEKTCSLVMALKKSMDVVIIESDERQLRQFKGIMETIKAMKAELCLPILFRREMIGFITLGRKKSGDYFNPGDIEVLMSLARTAAIAISNGKLFAQLSETQAEAAQSEKMAVIGTLAAGINHEICNPLGIIRGQCEVFLLNFRDGLYKDIPQEKVIEQAVIIMNKIIRETDRATGITKRLSAFSKPPKTFRFEEVNVDREIDAVMEILGHEMRVDNVTVRKELPVDFPNISADRKQIQEIMFNLIRNAAQAITEKGEIHITGKSNGATADILISDNGHGISQDKIEKIFNPFFTTKDPGKGTGLGLFIVKQVVERNNGRISVTSEPGKGSTFKLTFEVSEGTKAG